MKTVLTMYLLPVIALFVLVVAVIFGGVGPGFYLDDWSSLSGLEGYAGSNDFLQYVMNGVTGFPGRPLAYVTFWLQADAWPTDAGAFKVVNLILHLVNTALVYLLVLLLQRHTFLRDQPTFPLAVAFLWAIAPIQVGAVFYVVQRMTLLSALFCFVSLVGYAFLRGRNNKVGKKTIVLLSLFLGIGYLGILAKENAVLLGLLVLAIEMTVFSGFERNRLYRSFLVIVCVFPVVLVFVYGAVRGMFTLGYEYRDFSLLDRILSQGIILWDYIRLTIFPTNSGLNLFNDGYAVPETFSEVVFACLGWFLLALITFLAVRFRKKQPLLSLGWLLFAIGHLLESTIFPLELYFEHRNYVPSLGLFVTLLAFIYTAGLKVYDRSKKLLLVASGCWILWLVLVSWVESSVWGDPQKFAMSALADRPNSLRARQEVSAYYYRAGSVEGAAKLLYSIESDFGQFAGTYAQLLRLKCQDANIVLPSESALKERFLHADYDRGTAIAFRDIWEVKRAGNCKQLDWDLINRSLGWLTQNPEFEKRENFYFLRGAALLASDNTLKAYDVMVSYPQNSRSAEYQLTLVRLALLVGKKDDAETLLKAYEATHSSRWKEWYANKPLYDAVRERVMSKTTRAITE